MVWWNKRGVLICALSLLLFMGCLQEEKKPVIETNVLVDFLAEAQSCNDEQMIDMVQSDFEFDSAPPESPKPTDKKAQTLFSTVSKTTTTSSTSEIEPDSNTLKATFYKSTAPCRCCDKYFEYVEANGYQVEVVETKDMAVITSGYKISRELESCHTAIIEGYFVEGHVPIEAINKLLSERPDKDGITLPGKPYGAPGNRGAKTRKFTIYALSDGEASIFMIL